MGKFFGDFDNTDFRIFSVFMAIFKIAISGDLAIFWRICNFMAILNVKIFGDLVIFWRICNFMGIMNLKQKNKLR